MTHQPGVYMPLRALFLVDLTVHCIARLPQEYRSRWFSGIASALGARGLRFEPRPPNTKSIKNGTSGYLAWCSAL